jgi:hypothetical protein
MKSVVDVVLALDENCLVRRPRRYRAGAAQRDGWSTDGIC